MDIINWLVVCFVDYLIYQWIFPLLAIGIIGLTIAPFFLMIDRWKRSFKRRSAGYNGNQEAPHAPTITPGK